MVARHCMLAGKFIADMVSCKPLVNDSSFTENITLRKIIMFKQNNKNSTLLK